MTPVLNIQERIRSASISVSGDDREGGSSSKTKSKYNEVVKEKENKATKSTDHQNKGARPKFQTKYAPISHFSEKYSKNRPEPPTVPTVEELFKEAEGIIGFSPISREDITKWAWNSKNVANQDTDNDTDNKVFKSPVYEEERIHAGIHICESKLGFYPNEILITKAKFCFNTDKRISWFHVGKKFAKDIFKMRI